MRSFWRIGSVLVLLIFVTGMVRGQSLDNKDVEHIKSATFTTLDGETVSVKDFEGKVVLLDFWETWCSPCIESFPGMQKALDQFPDHFEVLAINSGFADSRKDVSSFIKKNDYDFVYAMDDDQLLAKKLGIRSIPFKIFIGPDGNLIKSKLGKLPDEYQHIKDLLAKHTNVEIKTQ